MEKANKHCPAQTFRPNILRGSLQSSGSSVQIQPEWLKDWKLSHHEALVYGYIRAQQLGEIPVPINQTQEDIAERLGMSRHTVLRIVKKLTRQGRIAGVRTISTSVILLNGELPQNFVFEGLSDVRV